MFMKNFEVLYFWVHGFSFAVHLKDSFSNNNSNTLTHTHIIRINAKSFSVGKLFA